MSVRVMMTALPFSLGFFVVLNSIAAFRFRLRVFGFRTTDFGFTLHPTSLPGDG